MTTEEKAKAYDEALKRFKIFKEKYYTRDTNFGDVIFDKTGEMQKDFESIFPELRESEDERIRMKLFHTVRGTPKDNEWFEEISKEAMLAWLEKQKEPENTSVSVMAPSCWEVEQKKQKPKRERNKPKESWLEKSKYELAHEEELLIKRQKELSEIRALKDKEQKPIQTDDEKEYIRTLKSLISDFIRDKKPEDIVFYQKIYDWLDGRHIEQEPNIELIQRSWYMEGYHDREFGKEPKWILKTGKGGPKHELNPRYGQPLAKEQKPVESITQDEIEQAMKALTDFKVFAAKEAKQYNISHQRDIDWHNFCASLLTYLEVNKPVEWSEEDEKRIQRICDFLWKNRKGDTDTIYQIEKDADWLKSLRPSWKPTYEQMEALRKAVNKLADTEVADSVRLSIMYDHLKELV